MTPTRRGSDTVASYDVVPTRWLDETGEMMRFVGLSLLGMLFLVVLRMMTRPRGQVGYRIGSISPAVRQADS